MITVWVIDQKVTSYRQGHISTTKAQGTITEETRNFGSNIVNVSYVLIHYV